MTHETDTVTMPYSVFTTRLPAQAYVVPATQYGMEEVPPYTIEAAVVMAVNEVHVADVVAMATAKSAFGGMTHVHLVFTVAVSPAAQSESRVSVVVIVLPLVEHPAPPHVVITGTPVAHEYEYDLLAGSPAMHPAD